MTVKNRQQVPREKDIAGGYRALRWISLSRMVRTLLGRVMLKPGEIATTAVTEGRIGPSRCVAT